MHELRNSSVLSFALFLVVFNTQIADFGLAKEKGQKQFLQSAVGTLTYNCPEIVQHHEYSEKADVWSLGCVLYHLLALRCAFAFPFHSVFKKE